MLFRSLIVLVFFINKADLHCPLDSNATNLECRCNEEYCWEKCCDFYQTLENGVCVVSNYDSTLKRSVNISVCNDAVYISVEDLSEWSSETHCLDVSFDGARYQPVICSKPNPIRKCCSSDEILLNTTCIARNTTETFFTSRSYLNRGILTCKAGKYRIKTEDFRLFDDGSLQWESDVFDSENYCVDYLTRDNVDFTLVALICVKDATPDHVQVTGMIISMPFLAITFLVYLIIPDKNLHRKALMFYVLSLLLSYVFLVTVQLHNDEFEEVPCHLLGYLIMFFFLASFFWMNVMCIDMWLAFSGWKGFASKRSSECKRFIYYSIYAWGLPGLHVFVVWLLNTHWMSDSEYHPQLGVRKCFLEDGLPVFFYFYFPMAILIGINIVLFAVTILKIRRVKKDTRMLKHTDSKRHSYEDDKQQQFRLYLKLMFAMGVNWIMEIVSWACLWRMKTIPTWVWYLTDLTNALYGVFIFFIFVAKKNIWKSLKKRYYVCIGKPYTAHSIVTSQTTRTSNVSSTDPGEHRMISLRN